MGDSMIETMPDTQGRARAVAVSADPFAPPFAPMAMPRQVLAPDFGAFKRTLGALINRLAQIKFSFRRIG